MKQYKFRVYVLRLGHRLVRDKRMSTHIGLVARAFGADGVIYVGNVEDEIIEKLKKTVETWGGPFSIRKIDSYRKFIDEWKKNGGVVVHLTMYGENIQTSEVLKRIMGRQSDILIIVGAEKVPREIYKLADFNVAIGNQPHSEVAALAVFLDRFFEGEELTKEFTSARLKILPRTNGKCVEKIS